MMEIKEQLMHITDVYLSKGQINVELSTKASFKLPPYDSSSTQRLLEKLRAPLTIKAEFDTVYLCEDNISFRTPTGTKRIMLQEQPDPMGTDDFLTTGFTDIRSLFLNGK
jgi:hypothetical protein